MRFADVSCPYCNGKLIQFDANAPTNSDYGSCFDNQTHYFFYQSDNSFKLVLYGDSSASVGANKSANSESTFYIELNDKKPVVYLLPPFHYKDSLNMIERHKKLLPFL